MVKESPVKQPRLAKDEVVSDSEEERVQTRRNLRLIVISSDSSDSDSDGGNEKSESESADDASVKKPSASWLMGVKNSETVPNSGDRYPRSTVQMKTPQKSLSKPKTDHAVKPRHMGVIELSDSDDSDEEPTQHPSKASSSGQDKHTNAGEAKEQTIISHGGCDDWLNDGSILVLDEPRGARKPKRINSDDSTRAPKTTKKAVDPFTLHIPGTMPLGKDVHKDPFSTPLKPGPKMSLENTAFQSKPRRTPGGQKALAAAELERRVAYAHELFVELNHTVFKGGLPADTQLIWSKRLLTTAGRARWHRSRTGEETSSIELAEKILDCDERIRNTLSHEMCHLASWVIDQAPGENHGSIWKAWASKVMKKRPEIEISTRHDYEIEYKYQWRCEKCTKVYGRHSKSIKSEEVVCGYCREGTLIPLFKTRATKTSSTPKTSKQAATKPQDSPHSLQRLKGLPHGNHDGRSTPSKSGRKGHPGHSDSDDDDDDLHHLTKALRSVKLSGIPVN